jgi:SAM-dependent methyltransferase
VLIPSFKEVAISSIRWAARWARSMLPLRARKAIVSRVGRRSVPGHLHFSTALLEDVGRRDPSALHRFLWSNHLASAATYEISEKFGASKFDGNRHRLFADIQTHLGARGHDPARDIRSVFEIGCSLGYLLRFVETEVFPAATVLRGIDIDRYAVETGQRYLRLLGSKVCLSMGDATEASRIMGEEKYDVILCCGMLMYLDEISAQNVIRDMILHARHVVGIICMAHNDLGNSTLKRSVYRTLDGGLVHNLERMIEQGGAAIVSRRIERTITDGNTCTILVAEPRESRVNTESSSPRFPPGLDFATSPLVE